MVCVAELLAPFLKFPEVNELTEANGGNKKFEFQKVLGKGGAINDTHTSSGILLKNDQKCSHLFLHIYFDV